MYSMLGAFHELYGIPALRVRKIPCMAYHRSRISCYTRQRTTGRTSRILFSGNGSLQRSIRIRKCCFWSCGDSYVQLISANARQAAGQRNRAYIHIIYDEDLTHKEKFYALCRRREWFIRRWIHRKEMGNGVPGCLLMPPYIIKPSNGVEYWKHPFPGQKKVLKAETREELEKYWMPFESGYDDSVIITGLYSRR